MLRAGWFLLLAIVLVPGEALASGGIQHAEEWVLRRDGAWIVNFLILFAGLYWIFKQYIIPALKHRSVELQNTLTESGDLKQRASDALEQIEEQLGKFETESLRMKNEAIADGEILRDKLIAEAKEQSKRILLKAKGEIDGEIMAAKKRLRIETVGLAMEMARNTLAKQVGKKDHAEIVKTYLGSVKEG